MQLNIHTRLTDSIQFQDGDYLQVTGKSNPWNVQEYTISVERVVPVGTTRQPAIRMTGPRILKSGAVSDYNAAVELPLDDPQVPEWLREGVEKLAAKVGQLRAIIAQQKEAMGVR